MSIQSRIDIWNSKKHSPYINKLFIDYTNDQCKSNLSEETIIWRLKNINWFLDYLDVQEEKEITKNNIYLYLESIKNSVSKRSIVNRSQCIRHFINWGYQNKLFDFNGNSVFPKIKNHKKENILSYYTNNEISKILSSIDRNKSNGKRDYIIIALFVYLGLRRNDIRTLKFENIDWENTLIKIYQSKTKTLLILPMIDDIKFPLLDYLKNERPNIKNDYIFIKNDGSLYYKEYFSTLVNRIIKNSGIDIKNRNYGCHTFRHSLATNLLGKHTDINTISSILGHSSTEVTIDTYISYDKNIMKILSMEVPQWK